MARSTRLISRFLSWPADADGACHPVCLLLTPSTLSTLTLGRLCEGVFANVVRFDGELMHNMAQHGFNPQAQEALARLFPARPTRASMSGRAILNGTVVYTEDVRGESRVGQGSTFSFTLPVGSASDQGGGEPPRP
jgi:hypothetical protein